MTAKLYQTIDELTDTSIVNAGISLRIGGFSEAPYSSLNLALHVGDDPVTVSRNQKIFSNNSKIQKIKYCKQIHSDIVYNSDEVSNSAWSIENQNVVAKEGDALISDRRGVTLGIFTADCIPIFILDRVTPAIGLAHAGWRGSFARIASKTITEMHISFGTQFKDCLINLGPSIQKCCYIVSTELLDGFVNRFGSDVKNEDRLCLQTANIKPLIDIGVPPASITTSQFCTSCNTDIFYSYRAEGGQTGRMLSFIQLTNRS